MIVRVIARTSTKQKQKQKQKQKKIEPLDSTVADLRGRQLIGEAEGLAVAQDLTMISSTAVFAGTLHTFAMLAIAHPVVTTLAIVETGSQVAATSLLMTYTGHASAVIDGVAGVPIAAIAFLALTCILVRTSVQAICVSSAWEGAIAAGVNRCATLSSIASEALSAVALEGAGPSGGTLGMATTHSGEITASVDGGAADTVTTIVGLTVTFVNGGTQSSAPRVLVAHRGGEFAVVDGLAVLAITHMAGLTDARVFATAQMIAYRVGMARRRGGLANIDLSTRATVA